MQVYSGGRRQQVVTSPTSESAISAIEALPRRQAQTNRVLHKRVQSHGLKTAKQRYSRIVVSGTKDLPLPVILEKNFDKEGSRIDKRTVRCCHRMPVQQLMNH